MSMFGNLFNKTSFGLDAGDDSIKFVELVKTKDGIKVGRHGEYQVHNKRELKETLSTLKKIFGSAPVYVSLPHGDRENMKEHISVLKNFGIKVKSYEHRTDAMSRSVIPRGDLGTYMIVSYGKNNSDIFIISGGEQKHHVEASNSVYFLRDEIAKHFLHWHTQKDQEDIRLPIKKIIICGGGSDLAEFAEHLAVHMKHKVDVANVWVNILDTSEDVPGIILEESLGFASALGVALKDF